MDNGLSVKDGARDCDHGVEIHALGKGAGKPSSGELAATGKSGSASGWPTFLKNWKTMVFLGREWSLLLLGWSQPRVLPLLRTTYYCNCILNSRALSTDRRTDVILPVGQKHERKGEEGAEQPVWRTENRRDTPRAVRRGVWCAHVEMWRCRGRGQQSLCSRRGALSRPRPGRRSQHLRLRERSAVARREPAEQGRDARGARGEGGGQGGLRTGAPTPAACQASTLGAERPRSSPQPLGSFRSCPNCTRGDCSQT